MKPLTCKELAPRIAAHLKRFEADPKINRGGEGHEARPRFWQAGAGSSGRYVFVRYIAYQGNTFLSRDDAARYLAWLDAGNVGRHYEALR